MSIIKNDEDKKVRSRISNDYGDIAVVGFGKSVSSIVGQITMMVYDESYLIQTKTEMIKLKEKRRRLIILIADLNDIFVRKNILEFLAAQSNQKICVVMQNAVGNSPLMQEIEKRTSLLSTHEQEEKDLCTLVQWLYGLVSHKNESLTYLDEDKNYYQLTSNTLFERGSRCYIYGKTDGLSLEDELQKDTLVKTRLTSARHCWLKLPPNLGLEKASKIMETIELEMDEDADFFIYGSDENSSIAYLLLIV